MEPLNDAVSVRVSRINSELTGKTTNNPDKPNLLTRESLLDVLQTLYDECSIENVQKQDANVAQFVEKYKVALKELKQLRVNITDFEIKNVIGRGHFGEVHVVKEKQTGDVYAMKTIRKFDSDIKRSHFEEERNIMAFSTSPWITSLQYAFQDSSYLFFIMEFHPGGDLLGLLCRQGSTLPESAATFYIAELVLALEDLHKMGYVHRDIKPDNILLDRCGHLKLADFGSAARLNSEGVIKLGAPVGTPDYIAPEVLQAFDNKSNGSGYGVSCDFWSLGALAYELTVGNTPFAGPSTTATYSKIMNFKNALKFPADVVLTQGYVTFVKSLLVDQKSRLNQKQIKNHILFKNTNFDTLRDQVPPYVPKISSTEDTSHFSDVQSKKNNPSIENFKKKSQFSGRNLPFVGFTFTHDYHNDFAQFNNEIPAVKTEEVQNLKSEVAGLRKKLLQSTDCADEKESIEKKYEEKARKLESIENVRDRLERDLAGNIAECAALKRTLELERRDRSELEKKALDLIKAAKLKWETAEKVKIEALELEIEQQKEKIIQLTTTNKMLSEQLDCALQVQGQHKKSLDKVHSLSRRSVMGLESRLEEVTSETEGVIADLRTRLSGEQNNNFILENKVKKMKDYQQQLLGKLEHSEKKYENLQVNVDVAEEVIKELGVKVNQLETDVECMQSYKEQIAELEERTEHLEKVGSQLEGQNKLLQLENKQFEACKRQVDELKGKISKLMSDDKCKKLERELLEEKDKCESLKKRLQDADSLQSESQELKELRTKFWRMEKEFANCKIDKRILERELREAQAAVAELNEKIANSSQLISESKKQSETALMELSNINESISLELMKVKDSYKNMQDKFNNEKERANDEKAIISELKAIIGTKDDKINLLHGELVATKSEKSGVEMQASKAEGEKGRLMNLVETLQKEKGDIFNELEKAKREILNTNLNLEALREACTLLENQLIEYEKINHNFVTKQSELNANTEKLIGDLCKAKQEVQDAKKLFNEEKSLKLLAETKVRHLNEDIECVQNENLSYKKQCIEYKDYSTSLVDELTVAEEKITSLEIVVKSYERQIEDFVAENRMLKEEVSEYLTKMSKVKDSNCKLSHQLKDSKESEQMLKHNIETMEGILFEKMHYFKDREMKSESTIKQQIKLIDFLQSKIDDQSQKKKTFADKLFGSSKKENTPPISLAMNYKDLESELLKERQGNKQLQEEVFRLKAELSTNSIDKIISKVERHKSEIVSPQTKIAMQQIVNSPRSLNGDLLRQNSVQRMHHNIPHRFESKLCTNLTKCAQCTHQIMIGRNINSCKECHVSVHPNCAAAMPRTCGLPRALVNHFKDSLTKLNENEAAARKFDQRDVNVEGWIKVPGKSNSWEKCYACLTDYAINTFNKPPKEADSVALETIELKPDDSHGRVILEPIASEVPIPVANSDLPFVLKVEIAPNTTCWPPKCFIFMTLAVQDKDVWFQALDNILCDPNEKYKTETILQIADGLNLNCVTDLTETMKIIGTEKGLYSHHNGNFVHIEGLSEVQHIALVPFTNVVLMIANEKSVLIQCDLNHLINLTQCAACTKPTLKFKPVHINSLNGFHILQVSKFAGKQKICIANRKQLIILNYDLESNEFKPVRILDTAEPTSSMLFTENSLIVGANKFFEIDLVSFQAEEFLDISDDKLKPAGKCYKMGSFPLAIMKIASNPKEYLLCFNEFSVFVDEYGRSSRDFEMKSTHLPLAFHFVKPYLYIIQFAAVEIIKITSDLCNGSEAIESVRIEFDRLRYLGCNKHGVYICHDKDVKFVDGKSLLDPDSSSIISESTDSDRFSFTSSIVQSLDGNLSDVDSELEHRAKKVTFSQTDL